MSIFGSFEYGTGVTYGPAATPAGVGQVEVISDSVIRVTFTGRVLLNEQLLNPDNYLIYFTSDPSSTDVLIQGIRPFVSGTFQALQGFVEPTTTTAIEIDTSPHSIGESYQLEIHNVESSDGTALPSGPSVLEGRNTKVDKILSAIPETYDVRRGTNLYGVLCALGLEDDRIGGSR